MTRPARTLPGPAAALTRVGFQGVPHAYSHLAAERFVDRHAQGQGAGTYVGHASFAAVLDALAAGDVDLAVLPVENTTAGSINQVYDLLQHRPVSVVGEQTWRVEHVLAGVQLVDPSTLTRVLSHPQGLEQCASYLRTLPATPWQSADTALAMREVAEAADPSWGAIGSAQAAAAHGLVVLARGIGDQELNYTRFLVLAREPRPVPPTRVCKTSLILVTGHREGALLRCLEVLARTGHSMTKLESRPLPGRPFEYLFFLDLAGNLAEPRTAAMLAELRAVTSELTVLGSYPAVTVDPAVPTAAAEDALESVLAPD